MNPWKLCDPWAPPLRREGRVVLDERDPWVLLCLRRGRSQARRRSGLRPRRLSSVTRRAFRGQKQGAGSRAVGDVAPTYGARRSQEWRNGPPVDGEWGVSPHGRRTQIGSASGRERECQDVSI